MDINKIQKPYWLTKQYPLDIRLWVPREEDLKDLGRNNHKAFTYYSGMIVVAADTGKMYIWKEFDPDRESGLLEEGFRYPHNYKFGGIDYSNKLYNFVEFPFGLEMRLTGKATMWNDQVTNFIRGEGTVEYALAEQTFEQTIPYAVYDDKVWIRVNLQAGGIITAKFYPDINYSPDNKSVFSLYDDFSAQDTSVWTYTNSIVVNGNLKVNGGNQIIGATTVKPIPANSIIEWSMYSGNYDFDSGIKVGNLYFISDKGTGFQAISTNWTYPTGSQQANTWNKYRVQLVNGNIQFINLTVNKTVTSSFSYTQGNLSFICDSDTSLNPLLVDYIVVRKWYNQDSITTSVIQELDGSYTVTITNNGTEDLIDTEIVIPGLPVDNYKATVIVTTPALACDSFPDGVVSNIKFFTQFNHMSMLGSKTAFHIHCYIPPNSPTGNVKLRLTWQTIPVEIVVDENETIDFGAVNKETKQIEKIFSITDNMKGRHVLFDFGHIDTVYSLSQIVFHKLERLGDDIDDTYAAPLPYLYVDWHSEVDSFGSQSEFVKY